jgi:hypothetical protein
MTEHPGWSRDEITRRLASAYQGYDPEALEAVLQKTADAVAGARHELGALQKLWGEIYDITWSPVNGRYRAESRDERKRTWTADTPGELAGCLRDDYAGQAS